MILIVFTEKFDWKYCHTAVMIGMFAIIVSWLLSFVIFYYLVISLFIALYFSLRSIIVN